MTTPPDPRDVLLAELIDAADEVYAGGDGPNDAVFCRLHDALVAFKSPRPESRDGEKDAREVLNMFAPGDFVRHSKGHVYLIMERCIYENTMTDCYAYRGKDGRVWIRPALQMEDGRFVRTVPEDRSDA